MVKYKTDEVALEKLLSIRKDSQRKEDFSVLRLDFINGALHVQSGGCERLSAEQQEIVKKQLISLLESFVD